MYIKIPHLKQSLSEKDKEFIKECTKTDLQKKQEEISRLHKEYFELQEKYNNLRKAISILSKEINENNCQFIVPINNPIVRTYNDMKDLPIEILETKKIYIPIETLFLNRLNEIYEQSDLY